MKGCRKKNPLSFSRCQEKLAEILFYKEDCRLGRAQIIIEEKEEEEGE
jgi:hypothetical protein